MEETVKSKDGRPDDINAQESTKKGVSGIFENTFRQFKNLGFIFLLVPIALLYIFCLGVALAPGIFVMQKIYYYVMAHNISLFVSSFFYGFGLGLLFLFFIITIMIH